MISFCLKILLTFTNSVDPDEMQHYAAFHLGLQCLQKYSFRGFRIQRDNWCTRLEVYASKLAVASMAESY